MTWLPTKVDPEIPGSLTWTIEYRISLIKLKDYSKISRQKRCKMESEFLQTT
jgi:hypothetical protein